MHKSVTDRKKVSSSKRDDLWHKAHSVSFYLLSKGFLKPEVLKPSYEKIAAAAALHDGDSIPTEKKAIRDSIKRFYFEHVRDEIKSRDRSTKFKTSPRIVRQVARAASVQRSSDAAGALRVKDEPKVDLK